MTFDLDVWDGGGHYRGVKFKGQATSSGRVVLPGPQLSSQRLRGLLPVSLLGEQRHDVCEQFA